jgi:hypothetical protein
MCLVLRSRGDHGQHRAPQCSAAETLAFRSAIALVTSLMAGPEPAFPVRRQQGARAGIESGRASPESASAPTHPGSRRRFRWLVPLTSRAVLVRMLTPETSTPGYLRWNDNNRGGRVELPVDLGARRLSSTARGYSVQDRLQSIVGSTYRRPTVPPPSGTSRAPRRLPDLRGCGIHAQCLVSVAADVLANCGNRQQFGPARCFLGGRQSKM